MEGGRKWPQKPQGGEAGGVVEYTMHATEASSG